MKRLPALFGLAVIFIVLGTTLAVAQSSGNFSAAVTNAACTLNTTTGELTGGHLPYTLGSPIKVSNGNGTALLVTPSLVTGLYTKTKIDSLLNTASAAVGIKVCLSVTDPDGNEVSGASIFPRQLNTETEEYESCIVYDQRFQQISSGLFNQIASCVPVDSGVACTTNADCAATEGTTSFCNIPAGATAGTCFSFPSDCSFDMILSTLGARSFNFIVTLPGGAYKINATWDLFGVSTTGASNTAACVGPGTLTTVQTKFFSNSGGEIIIQ